MMQRVALVRVIGFLVMIAHLAAGEGLQGPRHVVFISIRHQLFLARPDFLAGPAHLHRLAAQIQQRDLSPAHLRLPPARGGHYSAPVVAEPKVFSVRRPVAAGKFYPADPARCRAVAEALVAFPGKAPEAGQRLGGIIPHAGWICSGAIAGQVLGALGSGAAPEVVVVFGAVHTPIEIHVAALDSHEAWASPAGQSEVAGDLVEALRHSSDLFAVDDRLHDREHAVEVELPLIRAVWPHVRLLPVEVQVNDDAPAVGLRVAREVLQKGLRPVFLASSDLTHYGPGYGFAPAGVGIAGLEWAKENDRRLLRLVGSFDIDQIVPEVRGHHNACGAGAIAAMLAACREAGARSARVLRHASSYETLSGVVPQSAVDAVGYAGVIVQ